MSIIPFGDEGVPGGIWTEEFTQQELLAGHIPEYGAYPGFKAAGTVAMAAHTVVGVTGGFLVPATQAGAPRAIGVLTNPILASGRVQEVGVIRAGNLNVDALVWDPSFTTDAQKFAAFEGAPSPTNIVLQRVAG